MPQIFFVLAIQLLRAMLRRGCEAAVICLLLAGSIPADDEMGELQVTFMRDRPVFVQLNERVVEDQGRKVKQQFFVIVNEGEVALTESVAAHWTSRMRSFAILRDEAGSRLDGLLKLLQSHVAMTEEQLRKLRIAGQGDVSRYVAECEAVYLEHRVGKLSWAGFQELAPHCQSLQERFGKGLHQEGSLLYKLLATMLSPSELQRVSWLLQGDAQPRVLGGIR